MSSDILARVHALSTKADKLREKGHIVRAAENYGRAAEAARALGADNLVEAHMQIRQCSLLGGYALYAAHAATGADPRLCAAHRATYITLLSGAIAALERRRVAGTLLDGKCAAAEEAWSTARNMRQNANFPSDFAASLGALVGYHAYLGAAKDTAHA